MLKFCTLHNTNIILCCITYYSIRIYVWILQNTSSFKKEIYLNYMPHTIW